MEDSMEISFFELLKNQEDEMIQEIMQEHKDNNFPALEIGEDLKIYSFIPFNKEKSQK